jgi:hypothetical protein
MAQADSRLASEGSSVEQIEGKLVEKRGAKQRGRDTRPAFLEVIE